MSLFHLEEYKLVKIRNKCIDIELYMEESVVFSSKWAI